jgi:hypothetical protein
MSVGRKEFGHALVEVVILGLVLLVPVIWMMSVFSELHAAALATTSAVREAGFEAARSGDALSAGKGITSSVQTAIADHGLEPDRADLAWTPTEGWRRGGAVEIVVTYRVPVFQAPLLGAVTEPSISVDARHVTSIDRYRSREE